MYRPPKDIDEALSILDSGNVVRVRVAAEYLAAIPVDESRRAEVEPRLARHLSTRPTSERDKVLFALVKWGTTSSAAKVADLLRRGDPKPEEAKQALMFLTQVGDTSAAEAAAHYLDSSIAGDAAVDYLLLAGAGSKDYVIEQFKLSNDVTRARKVLESYGVDTNTLLREKHLAALNSTNSLAVRNAANALAATPVDAVTRQRVAKALEDALKSSTSSKSELLKALKTWGSKENVAGICLELGNYGSRDAALETLVAIGDIAAAPHIAERLKGDFGSEVAFADRAAAALKKLGAETKPHVLAQFHAGGDATRARISNLLRELGATPEEIYGQTLADLKGFDAKRKESAIKWLLTAEIEPTQRSALAQELVTCAQTGGFLLQRDAVKAFARWATKDQAAQLIALIGNSDEEVMRTALVNSLAFEDPTLATGIANQLGLRMGDEYRLDSTALVLARIELQNAGAKAEDVLIGLLRKEFRGEVVQMAAELLTNVGTEKALSPLSGMATYARTKRATSISMACSNAQRAIRARLDAAKEPAGM
jgi:hypothetical protein